MNYQHLFYFKTVANLGGITAAARRLHLTPPTLSSQIRSFEESLDVTLFERSARGMSLTEDGRIALGYAERIFALGTELEQTLHRDSERAVRVGIDTLLVAAIIRPFLTRLAAVVDEGRVICSFARHDELFESFAASQLEIVLTAMPRSRDDLGDLTLRLVTESEMAFYGNRAAAEALRPGFPGALDGAPYVAAPMTPLRDAVERWLQRAGVRLAVTVEIDDASVAAALAADGVGIITAPRAAEVELDKRYDLQRIGTATGILSRVHALGAVDLVERVLAETSAADGDAASPEGDGPLASPIASL